MKEYKYKINGNDYSVAIIDIDGTTAAVEVNGVSYKVDILDEGFSAPVARPQHPQPLLLLHLRQLLPLRPSPSLLPLLQHPLLSLLHLLARVRPYSRPCLVSSSTSRWQSVTRSRLVRRWLSSRL
mgnify:CR=1 FL=1